MTEIEIATIFCHKVTFTDTSFFWRGECNGCDWSDEALDTQILHSLAEVHLLVFHQGGVIDFGKDNQQFKVER